MNANEQDELKQLRQAVEQQNEHICSLSYGLSRLLETVAPNSYNARCLRQSLRRAHDIFPEALDNLMWEVQDEIVSTVKG